MQVTNLAGLDLNLLVALDALIAESHVGRAASRVGLSQPAMSHALARLRETLRDPLLVRMGARMELTPRAEQLKAPLAAALEQVRGLFTAETFNPATSMRSFTIMMPDLVLGLILPPLIERVGVEAPRAQVHVTPLLWPAAMTGDIGRHVDLVIACMGDAFPGFHRQRLYKDSDALAVRANHPERSRLKRMDAFLAARHVAVIGAGRREDMIDEWLRADGIDRDIALVVPTYMQALHIAARTDLVAFVPRRQIEAHKRELSLAVVEPPIDPGSDEQFLFYPVRAQNDPASIWLRNIVLAIGRSLDPSASRKKR